MKCINCKGDWTSPSGITITECPFCKKPIDPTKASKIFENPKEALCFITQIYGAEALLTKNYFSDIAPNLRDERELIKIFREKGVLDILNGALKSSESDQILAIKRAIGKLPSYLQNSTEAISLMNDFVYALSWNIPSSSVTKSDSLVILNAALPAQSTKLHNNNDIKNNSYYGRIIRFGDYNWRVLDVNNGQALLLCEKVIEEKSYHSSWSATTWAECELRGYLNSTFYSSFGQDKSQIIEVRNNNPNNLWFNTNGGNETIDRIFLLSLEEVDKYFGNSGDYTNNRRKKWNRDKYSSANNGNYISNNDDPLRIVESSNRAWNGWWLRSPGFNNNRASFVHFDGAIDVFGLDVHIEKANIRPAMWLKL